LGRTQGSAAGTIAKKSQVSIQWVWRHGNPAKTFLTNGGSSYLVAIVNFASGNKIPCAVSGEDELAKEHTIKVIAAAKRMSLRRQRGGWKFRPPAPLDAWLMNLMKQCC